MSRRIIMATERKFHTMIEIFYTIMSFAHMSGVSFIQKENKDGEKPKYSIKLESTAEIEVALQKAKADKLLKWIHEASRNKLVVNDGQSKLELNDDQVMLILAEIPPQHRVEMLKIYNSGTKEKFKRALVRLMIRPTKRMEFLKAWWEKTQSLSKNITLDPETKANINKFVAEKSKAMNERSERLKKAYQPKEYNNRFINFLTNNWLVNMYRL